MAFVERQQAIRSASQFWWRAFGSILTAISLFVLATKLHQIGIAPALAGVVSGYVAIREFVASWFFFLPTLQDFVKDSIVLLIFIMGAGARAVYSRTTSIIVAGTMLGALVAPFVLLALVASDPAFVVSVELQAVLLPFLVIASLAYVWLFSSMLDGWARNAGSIATFVHGLRMQMREFAISVTINIVVGIIAAVLLLALNWALTP